MISQYYYQQMSRLQQTVYRQMYDGLSALSPSFQVTALSMQELSEILFQLRLDHPQIFYVTGFSCRKAQGADSVMMQPKYMFEKKKIREHQKTLQARMERLLRPAENLGELEKERYIHSFICENVRYDKLKKHYSHEIIGPLHQGIGVCEGIAKTVKLFCDKLNIECMVVICGEDPEHGNPYRHAWNILKIQGVYYHLDATFDLTLSRYGTARFDYFNLDDKQMFKDHRPLIYPAPACTKGDVFYYKEEKLSFTKEEEVGKRVQQAIRKKQAHYVFHWRGGYLNQEIVKRLMEAVAKAAEEKGKSVTVSINVPQAVFLLSFHDDMRKLEIEEEQAEEN